MQFLAGFLCCLLLVALVGAGLYVRAVIAVHNAEYADHRPH